MIYYSIHTEEEEWKSETGTVNMKTISSEGKVYNIAMTAMMICIIMVSIALFRIPIPFTQGFVNLSDAMVFMGVIILGWKYGAIAAGLGSLLGDLLSGFPVWAPWSLVIKAGMALIFGMALQTLVENKHWSVSPRRFLTVEVLGMIIAGVFMTAAYYFAEGIMYGNWVVAALGIPWNIGQALVGACLAVILNTALTKTSLRSRMVYSMPER